MSRTQLQKRKILYVRKILLENSDEKHGLTVNEIIDMLEQVGISAERKSIYDDIEVLRNLGLDICTSRDKSVRYYVGNRKFEIPELKLLVDAIQSSRFITYSKSRELIKKIEQLASVYDEKLLHRQVFISNRVKTINEQIYYNIDRIHNAISENKQITFKYCEVTVSFKSGAHFELKEKHNGKLYKVSPYALLWERENYYLISYDEDSQSVRHYRVDKMLFLTQSDENRIFSEQLFSLDPANYSKQIFSMYKGVSCNLTLRCENSFAGVIADKFGNDVFLSKADDNHFDIKINVEVSDQFYGWLTGFGGGVRIIKPSEILNNYNKFLKKILNPQ